MLHGVGIAPASAKVALSGGRVGGGTGRGQDGPGLDLFARRVETAFSGFANSNVYFFRVPEVEGLSKPHLDKG